MTHTKSILITRNLAKQSCFYSLVKKGYNIVDKSLIAFKAVEVLEFPDTEWIFFYSKNAFKYFLLNINQEQQIYYLSKKIGCIGTQTAYYISSCIKRDVDFIADSNLSRLGKDFIPNLGKKGTVLIPRAKNSLRRLEKLLLEEQYHSIVVYSNNTLDIDFDTNFELLVFTSPKNAAGFFKNNTRSGAKIITIGQSTHNETLKHTNPLGVFISPKPEEYVLCQTAHQVLSTFIPQ